MKALVTSLLLILLVATPSSLKAGPAMFEFVDNLDWSGYFDKTELDFDICSCEIEDTKQYPIGFKMRYVEPIMAINLSNTPWNLVGMGLKMDKSMFRKQGTSRGSGKDHFMFKYVNSIIFPVLGWTIGMAQDYVCFERGTFLNMAYFSEADPTYNSDVLGFLASAANPLSRVWFSNVIAETACAIDCTMSTITGKPANSLYFCNGCNGSAYAADTGYTRMGLNVVNSETILFRMLAKMHTYGGMLQTSDTSFSQNPTNSDIRSSRCEPKYFPTIIKQQYFVQLPNNDMQPTGKMRFHYDFKSKPNDEDDVFFWLWRMRDICVGATKCRSTFTGL